MSSYHSVHTDVGSDNLIWGQALWAGSYRLQESRWVFHQKAVKVESSRVIIYAILDASLHSLKYSAFEQTGTKYTVYSFDAGRVYRCYKWLVVMKVPVRLT